MKSLYCHFSELIREMEEFEARTAQKHQIHKQLLSGQLAAIEEMSHKQRQQQQQQGDDSDTKSSNQQFQMEKRDSNALASQFFESGYDSVADSPTAYKGGNSIGFQNLRPKPGGIRG